VQDGLLVAVTLLGHPQLGSYAGIVRLSSKALQEDSIAPEAAEDAG
jgi:hypothetical protein